MTRVLNVSSAYNPKGGTIAKLRALMRSSIHKHYLYHPGYNKNKDNILRELPYYSTIGVKAFAGFHNRNIFAHVKEINQIIKEYDIQIVHLYFNFEMLFAPLIKLFNPNIVIVRSIEGFDEKLPTWREKIISYAMRYVDHFVLISKYIKHLYESTYPVLKLKNSTIIYNSAVNVRNCSGYSNKRKNLVTISEICARKNLTVLIEAMNIIKNVYKRTDILLQIIGDGKRQIVTDPISKYHLEDVVELVGYTDKVPQYLENCAIYVHPATTEGFGIAVTEAMQMYCPCIVADKGALPELIKDGENGFIIDAYNPQIWAEKIIYLMDNFELREYFANNNYHRAVSVFNLDKYTSKHDELYSSISNAQKLIQVFSLIISYQAAKHFRD